jgi:hypothetical protein
MLGDRIRNRRILLFSDNMAVVHIITNWYSKSGALRALVAAILGHARAKHIDLTAMWISTTENLVADQLSRMIDEYKLRLRDTVYRHLSNVFGLRELLESCRGE